MSNHIEKLFDICKEQPFDSEKISSYIRNNQMNSEEVTRTAIKLCEYGEFSYSNYLYINDKEPFPEELSTYNWDKLFDVLIANGLDAGIVICDDESQEKNVLQSLQYIDDGDLNVRILRNILSHGGTPNIIIDKTPFFEEIDADFIADIQLDCYPYKWQFDNAFRFWLVLVGFGGVIKNGKIPVNMCCEDSTDIFRKFENFDYRIIRKNDDFELQIIDKKTERIVATL